MFMVGAVAALTLAIGFVIGTLSGTSSTTLVYVRSMHPVWHLPQYGLRYVHKYDRPRVYFEYPPLRNGDSRAADLRNPRPPRTPQIPNWYKIA
eukprot:766139-Amphidinium_carterae.1